MKKLLATLAAAALSLSASAVFANGDGTGIAGSPHDFTDGVILGVAGGDETWNQRNEICRTCHVPHDHARNLYTEGLLWNRQLSAQTYTLYDSSSMGSTTQQPIGRAKMCLSCHDDTVALDQYDSYVGVGNVGGGNGTLSFLDKYADAQFVIGSTGNLAGTHPISVVYADANRMNPTTTPMGASGTIENVLDNGMVQCSSCHDVHNRLSVGNTHLLRVAQTVAQGGTASGLCLTCHDK